MSFLHYLYIAKKIFFLICLLYNELWSIILMNQKKNGKIKNYFESNKSQKLVSG